VELVKHIKYIKELMVAMERTGVGKLIFKEDEFELHLERDTGAQVVYPQHLSANKGSFAVAELHPTHLPVPPHHGHEMAMSAGPKVVSASQEKSLQDQNSKYVVSPMVGTLYTSPSPEDPSFIKIGDRIEENTVVCIVEAMKVMNEVKAGVSGVVAELLIENGHPVEFGTKIFRVV
jgi:acetyl-CoA carboxylase biotin carboxyl carrier protein